MPYRNHHTSYLCQVISLSRTVIILYTWKSNSLFSFVFFLHLKVSKIHSSPPTLFSKVYYQVLLYVYTWSFYGFCFNSMILLAKRKKSLFLILQLWLERISKKFFFFFWKTKIDINSLKLVHFKVFWVFFFLLFSFHILRQNQLRFI